MRMKNYAEPTRQSPTVQKFKKKINKTEQLTINIYLKKKTEF